MARLVDRYELGEVLGTGGMAQVVAGFDHVLERPVAIKLIREDLIQDATSRERLLREARGAARLQHPNAVAVYDVVEADGTPSIVMELVEGPTLGAVLETGSIPLERVVDIVGQALAGLAAAHDRGLVHRDVKPNNILLPTSGGAKLADFGIAQVLSQSQTQLTATGQVLGTPRYLSPEQASGQPATAASDVYAMGVVAYECLAGRPLFGAQTPIALALAHQVAEVPPLPPETPPALAAVVTRALSKDPAARYADAGQMLRAWRSEQGVAPPPLRQPAAPAPAAPTAPAAPVPAAPVGVGARDATQVLGASAGTTQVAAADASATTSAAPSTGEQAGRGKRPWLFAAAVGAVALIVLVAFALNGGQDGDPADGSGDVESGGATEVAEDPDPETPDPADESDLGDEPDPADEPEAPDADPSAEDPDGTQQETEPSADEPPADDGRETDDGGADTLAELIGELEGDPGAAGDKHDDLLDDLRQIDGHGSENQRRNLSREAIAEIAEWLDDGELDAGVGERAISLLDPIARPENAVLADAHSLFVEVARNLSQWGEKGEDILDDLEDLLQERSGPRISSAAQELIEGIEEWVEDGDLDRQRGDDAVRILAPLADG